MFVRITYENGYCGCEESVALEVENMEEAEAYATEGIVDYAESYEHVASGWNDDFESEEERDYYYENCIFRIEEITEEEYEEEKYIDFFVDD